MAAEAGVFSTHCSVRTRSLSPLYSNTNLNDIGWQNSATYGSVIGYNMYWIVVIIGFVLMRYNEKTGHWPFMKAKPATSPTIPESESGGSDEAVLENKKESESKIAPTDLKSAST